MTYLKQFERLLTPLTPTQRAEVMAYYEEFVLDAGLNSDQAIQRQLGTPEVLARQTLAEYGDAPEQPATGTRRQRGRSAARPALGGRIALTPVAAIGAIIALALSIALGAIVLALGVAGLGTVLIGAWLTNRSLAAASFYAGIGLMGLGCAHLLAPALTRGVPAMWRGLARLWQVVIGGHHEG